MQYCDCYHTKPRFLQQPSGQFFSSLFSIHLLFTTSCSGSLYSTSSFILPRQCMLFHSVLCYIPMLTPQTSIHSPSLTLYSTAITSSLLDIVILWSLFSTRENYMVFYLISIFLISSPIYLPHTLLQIYGLRQSCLCCNVTWHHCTFSPFLLCRYNLSSSLPLSLFLLTSFTPISFLNATSLKSISASSFCFEVGKN
jgi:hypothetical protein